MIFGQQLKITFRKSSAPPHPHWKNPLLPFHSRPLKIQKVQVPPFCQHWKFFRVSLQKRGGGHCDNQIYTMLMLYNVILYPPPKCHFFSPLELQSIRWCNAKSGFLMWGVISGHDGACLSLNSSWLSDTLGGNWGGVGTTGCKMSCWLTNGSPPCSGAVRKCSFWEVTSLGIATGMVEERIHHCL